MFGHFKQGSGTLFGNATNGASGQNSTTLFGNNAPLFGSPSKQETSSPFKGTPKYDEDNDEEGADEKHQALQTTIVAAKDVFQKVISLSVAKFKVAAPAAAK